MNRLLTLVLLILSAGCTVGHKDFVYLRNQAIGMKENRTEPYSWPDSDKLIRSDYLVAGKGLTKIGTNRQGDLIYHYSVSEVLPHFDTKEWVGKCLIYQVVDPVTKQIKDWGFDEGGNPQSCRTWP